jgi:hypothetical protein
MLRLPSAGFSMPLKYDNDNVFLKILVNRCFTIKKKAEQFRRCDAVYDQSVTCRSVFLPGFSQIHHVFQRILQLSAVRVRIRSMINRVRM